MRSFPFRISLSVHLDSCIPFKATSISPDAPVSRPCPPRLVPHSRPPDLDLVALDTGSSDPGILALPALLVPLILKEATYIHKRSKVRLVVAYAVGALCKGRLSIFDQLLFGTDEVPARLVINAVAIRAWEWVGRVDGDG